MEFTKIRNYLFLGALTITTLLLAWLFKPFAFPIFWAAVIAVLFYPAYERINERVRHPSLSAMLGIMFITIIIILPLTLLALLLINQLVQLYSVFNDNRDHIGELIRNIVDFLRSNPLLARLDINEGTITERIADTGNTILNYLFSGLKAITQNSVTLLVMFVLMLYTLFFFLRDGKTMLEKLRFLIPLGNKYETLLYRKFTSTARATLKGTLVLGMLQGALGAILFWATGIPGALIWGIFMAAFSIIPGLGSFVVWFPAGVIKIFTGDLVAGILILAIGGAFISTIDNILRPILVGKDLEMHPLLILFSTLGGLAMFGISGFVIGPIIVSFFSALWQMYEHYYHTELSNN